MNKTLILLRGVSGAGKSTVAELLMNGWSVHLEADMYHYKNGIYDFKIENLSKSHEWCKQQVEEFMFSSMPSVIVSNTSTTEKEINPYIELAEKYEYNVVSLIVENRHGEENIHNVPEETLVKQEKRLRQSIKLRG